MINYSNPGPSISEAASSLKEYGWLHWPLFDPSVVKRMSDEYNRLRLWRPDEEDRGTGHRRPFLLGRSVAVDYLAGTRRIPSSIGAIEAVTAVVHELGAADEELEVLSAWAPNRLVVNRMKPGGIIYPHNDVPRYVGILVAISCQAAEFSCGGDEFTVNPGDAVALLAEDLAHRVGIEPAEHSVHNLDAVRYSPVVTQDTKPGLIPTRAAKVT